MCISVAVRDRARLRCRICDVGVTVGSGESVNVEAADVLIPGDDPRILTHLIDLSRKTERNFRQNLSFSIL